MFLARHSISALPDKKRIRKLLKAKPNFLQCGPGEVLCLVDSGSTVNAAWIARHFPAFTSKVQPTPASERGDTATTACGKQLRNKGRVVIPAKVAGKAFPVAFKDMEVEMPILSVRKMVKRRNVVRFADGGGTIRNSQTGRTIRFYEHEGVYFLKLKVDDVTDMVIDDDPMEVEPGFTRPGM